MTEAKKKLAELIKGIEFAMLSTMEEDGTIHSRPMATQQTEFSEHLWFFTWASSHKVLEVAKHKQVNLSYANPEKNRYVSVSGTAELVRDRKKAEELWNPLLKSWFPKGLDDPDLALLKVHPTKAEYWDSPGGAVVHLFGMLKSQITGKPPHPGDHGKLEDVG